MPTSTPTPVKNTTIVSETPASNTTTVSETPAENTTTVPKTPAENTITRGWRYYQLQNPRGGIIKVLVNGAVRFLERPKNDGYSLPVIEGFITALNSGQLVSFHLNFAEDLVAYSLRVTKRLMTEIRIKKRIYKTNYIIIWTKSILSN
jgi:hypothetical protein